MQHPSSQADPLSSDPIDLPSSPPLNPRKEPSTGRDTNKLTLRETNDHLALYEAIRKAHACTDPQCTLGRQGGVVGCYVLMGRHYELTAAVITFWREEIRHDDKCSIEVPNKATIEKIIECHIARHPDENSQGKSVGKGKKQEPSVQQQYHYSQRF